MFDTRREAELQRSRGQASVGFEDHAGKTRLVDLYHSGSAKAMLPRSAEVVPEVMFLNT